MLKNKVILIAGGTGGIGSQATELLLANDARVVVLYYRNQKRARDLANKLKNKELFIFKVDITKDYAVKKAMKKIQNEIGEIDILINLTCAPLSHKPYMKLKWLDFKRHLDVQLKGTFNLINACLPSMLRRSKGKIINIISDVVFNKPPANNADYNSAKYATFGLSKSLAVELGPVGINVNCISPGLTDTDLIKELPTKVKELAAYQTPLKRTATPIDVAGAILFLCSPYSDFITGANIPVCGGINMS